MLQRALLNAPPETPAFRISRYQPAERLTPYIEHYWMVSWDLEAGRAHTQETLPDPNVHVVFERNNSQVYGVVTSKFSRRIAGTSQVFGTRFAPAMFRPIYRRTVSQLTDRTLPIIDVFGNEATGSEQKLASGLPDDEIVAAANCFWQARIPDPDQRAENVRDFVRRIREERNLLTVDDVCKRLAVSKRTLQRLFDEYVGVSPKWVIRRYRLQELLQRLLSDGETDLSNLAVSLGYFDQAHLINDFKSIVGYTPVQFRKSL